MLPLIYMQGRADVERRVLKGGAILQSSNIATKHTGSASVQTADKDILAVVFIVLWHKYYRFEPSDETTSALPSLRDSLWRSRLILVRANSGNIAMI